jgi:hypothetical protein
MYAVLVSGRQVDELDAAYGPFSKRSRAVALMDHLRDPDGKGFRDPDEYSVFVVPLMRYDDA